MIRMTLRFSMTVLTSILFFSGCRDSDEVMPQAPVRKVKFELFTTEDFSQENTIITFEARIGGKTLLWDSVFAPMKLKDIPSAAAKIAFEKKVPNDDGSQLTVGFKYTLQDVGISWHYEPMNPEEKLKVVSYDFK